MESKSGPNLPNHGHAFLPRLGRGHVGDDGRGEADVTLGESA